MVYKIGKVYMIIKIDDPTVNYVGSTFTTLRQRWQKHKITYNNGYNSCSIKEYFDKYGIDKFKIILIKEYEVYAENQKDTKQLRAYEQLWINKFKLKNCCINKHNALDLLKRVYIKQYRKLNKEKAKEYRKVNKEKISKQKKEWYQVNKKKILEQKKEYREANKEKVECPICNSIVQKSGLSKHQKTKKCLSIKNNI